ncbi:MAG TPA: translation initiation factor IF-2, partial [Polyangia bacterium]
MIGSGFERRDPTDGGGGGGGARMRVYELAKELNIPHKDLLTKIRAMGMEIANHMSNLEPGEADRIRRTIDRERHETLVEQRLSDTVIRRRSRVPAAAAPAPAAAPPPAATARPATPPPPAAPVAAKAPAAPPAPTAPAAKPAAPPAVEAKETGKVAPPPAASTPAVATRPAEPAKPEPKPEVTAPVAEAPRPAPTPEKTAVEALATPEAPPAPRVETPAPPPIEVKPPVSEAPPKAAEPAAVAPPPPPRPPAAPVNRPVMVDVPRATSAGSLTGTGPSRSVSATSGGSADTRPPLKTIVQPVITGSAATGAFIQLPGHPPRGQAGAQPAGVPRVEITNRDEELRRLGRAGLMARGTTSGDRFGRGPMQPGQRPGGPPRKKMVAAGKKVKQTQITTPAEHKRVVKMGDAIAVSDLAQRMGVKGNEIIKKLWSLGMMGVTINQNIDLDTAGLIAQEFGYQVESTAFREDEVISEEVEENPEDLMPRAPVVTVMGHVDHGKTSLLDVIRKANVAAGEAGGITQHIGAYKVPTPTGGEVVFLDTPGHEAFTAMRARGAKMTDIVVLVVAADDGPMPQTIEAINHARAAEVPIVVAVNKIDKPGANPAAIRTKLMEHHLVAEEFGGDTIFVDVSAKTKQGIDKLLEMLALQADVLELKANPKKAGRGHVVEARLDRSRGAISTILVEEGTLRVGDLVVSGEVSGKIRAMLSKGQPISEAGPSTPVEVLGLDGVSEAGELFHVVADEKAAK